jgi:hypothetical protein
VQKRVYFDQTASFVRQSGSCQLVRSVQAQTTIIFTLVNRW